MIDRMDLINDPDVMKLARKLKDIDCVEQVRYWPVIKKQFLDMHGDNTVTFTCMIKSKLHTNELEHHVGFWRIVSETVYRDEYLHTRIIDDFKSEIEEYQNTGELNNRRNIYQHSPGSGTSNTEPTIIG